MYLCARVGSSKVDLFLDRGVFGKPEKEMNDHYDLIKLLKAF
jgi:hypothetical protein